MRRFFPLTTIVRRIDELLRPAMEKSFWVKAEISSGRLKGRNFYCDLVESDQSGHLNAQVRCTIWGSELERIRKNFRNQGLDLQLDDGTVVGLLCRVQFHPVYGLALRGIDMDPALALGEIELRKRAIIEKLKAEGLEKRNADHVLPLLPVRIGLVTSEGSAAFYDFTKTLFGSGFGFSIELANASMQGDQTERSVIQALKTLAGLNLDLVVICRGGGSKTDLSWLDNESIARMIADYPLPVWTGIGHDIDISVLDVVAAASFKTPTAVAEELTGIFEGLQQRLAQAQHNLRSVWRMRLNADREWLDDSVEGMERGVRKLLDVRRSQMESRLQSLNGRMQERLGRAGRQLAGHRDGLATRVGSTLSIHRQKNGERQRRLEQGSTRKINEAHRLLTSHGSRLRVERWLNILKREEELLSRQRNRLLHGHIWSRLEREGQKVESSSKLLKSRDPQRNLDRGYALMRDEQGRPLDRQKKIRPGDLLKLDYASGHLTTRVESTDQNLKN